MKKNRKQIVRVLALVLVVLMVLGMVISGLITALSETERDKYTMNIEYMQDEQALHITQCLVYHAPTSDHDLKEVVFYAYANMFRRQDALMYAEEDYSAYFPQGYVPGGIEMIGVRFNGAAADWGMQGENELYLRVACDIPAGGSGVFEFEYYILLTENAAFMGVDENGARLTDFYLMPGMYNEQYGEYEMKTPQAFTRSMDTTAADYDVTVTLPDGYDLAATGETVRASDGVWHCAAENVRAFALCFSRAVREHAMTTEGGVTLKLFTANRAADALLKTAKAAVEYCEARFCEYPVDTLTLITCGTSAALNEPGLLILPEEADEADIRFGIAQQIFGYAAYTEPLADCWLSDSLCNYLAYRMLEDDEGNNAFVKAMNADWVPALQLTVPGGLVITSDASLMDADEYDIIIRSRGAAVFYELSLAMGEEALNDGLKRFYEMGADGHTLTEMELVEALNAADGGDWEAFLTDWVFNVDEYVDQYIDWYE